MSTQSPTISVVTPTYDDPETLPLALASLVAQTREDWECIVVDDGSQQSPLPGEIVAEFEDPRMRTIEFPENLGRPKARQAGLDAAEGEFLCMLDADDWYVPRKLERQVEIAREYPECAVVSSDLFIENAEGELHAVSESRPELREERRVGDIAVSLLRWTEWGRPPVSHGASMLRMNRARTAMYDSDLSRTEDMDFLIRTTLGERFAIVHEPLYVYSLSGATIRLERLFESVRNELTICRKHGVDHPLRAGLHAATLAAKAIAYKLLSTAGIDPVEVRSPYRTPTEPERRRLAEARDRVERLLVLGSSS